MPSGVISTVSMSDASSGASAARAFSMSPSEGSQTEHATGAFWSPVERLKRTVVTTFSFGIDHQAPVARVDVGVRERQVVDAAGLFLERDRVADPDRLRDREQDARQRVRQHLARGEAEHDAEHGARSKKAGCELLELGELAERQADPDEHDRHEDEPANDAKAGRRSARDADVRHLAREAPAARQDDSIHEVGEHDRNGDRDDRRRRDPRCF